MTSPDLTQSSYRLPPLLKSASGGDLVSGIVDKFNSLTVIDKDEQRDHYERQITKLKAALDRAQMAREEAETEARKLREKLLDIQDERQKEKTALRERAQEYEKKYEKAKDRFKMQRAKHAEESHKIQKESMETEKRHWRTLALAQEEIEWERTLRLETQDLVDFVELERHFEAAAARLNPPRASITKRQSPAPEQELSFQTAHESGDCALDSTDEGDGMTDSAVGISTQASEPVVEIEVYTASDIQTPKRQIVRTIPVHFNDTTEDKENHTPAHSAQQTVADVLKTPMTMDREAALKAIAYRRDRAKSFTNAQTKGKLEILDRRDVSAPPGITMSVGRRK